jgi:ketosteroid isomerase-like protein
MSQESVEVVRRIYENRLIDANPAQILALIGPEFEYVNPPEAVEPGVRRGLAAAGRALQNASQGWDSSRYELHEIFDGGDTVVASVSFFARSRGSETEVVQEEAHTWTFRNHRIVRFEWGRDLDAALEAAGLRE